jgi:hypothetical protein
MVLSDYMGATALLTMWNMVLIQGYKFFKKSQSHLKILGASKSAMNQVPQ